MASIEFSISLLKIPVSDIARSATFYRDSLGFEEMFVVPEYGWAQLKSGNLQLALYKPGMGGGDRSLGGTVDFHLEVADLERYLAHLISKGTNAGTGIQKGDDGTQFVEVTDPDGNVLKIMKK